MVTHVDPRLGVVEFHAHCEECSLLHWLLYHSHSAGEQSALGLLVAQVHRGTRFLLNLGVKLLHELISTMSAYREDDVTLPSLWAFLGLSYKPSVVLVS